MELAKRDRRPVRGMTVEAGYAAVVRRRDPWWIGWIEEVPGVSSQGATREELLDNLCSALEEALEMNRADALAAAQGVPVADRARDQAHQAGTRCPAADPLTLVIWLMFRC
jgi:predicted RNase H-like HicB family nuclease